MGQFILDGSAPYKIVSEMGQKAVYDFIYQGFISDWYDEVEICDDFYIAGRDEKYAIFSLVGDTLSPLSKWWDDIIIPKQNSVDWKEKIYIAGRCRSGFFDREYAVFRIADPDKPISPWIYVEKEPYISMCFALKYAENIHILGDVTSMFKSILEEV